MTRSGPGHRRRGGRGVDARPCRGGREGRQTYVVCPLIEESDKLQVASAEETYERLTGGELADLRVGLLHGRITAAEKEKVMDLFRSAALDVLVATTVIEVGVDVPNATVMVVLDADRFGMAQLHQLRGRVGRGAHASTCFLLGEATTPDGEERLTAMVRTTDGFELAEVDLDIRGEGTIMGERQKGRNDLKLASLRRDRERAGPQRGQVAVRGPRSRPRSRGAPAPRRGGRAVPGRGRGRLPAQGVGERRRYPGRMRVVAGSAGGLRLEAPPGDRVRPTSDRVREATFNALVSLGAVEGVEVLDLFAGSGALGIEALSRGAARATFVERDPSVVRLLKDNVCGCGFQDRAVLRRADVERPGCDLATTDPGISRWSTRRTRSTGGTICSDGCRPSWP
ncbi:MAG: RsmD family RNA methyltransferase [Acidimicrobiia bacterium]|nr:RsmD family RNA methyltransferase [Acidimicrobiia bacterium]